MTAVVAPASSDSVASMTSNAFQRSVAASTSASDSTGSSRASSSSSRSSSAARVDVPLALLGPGYDGAEEEDLERLGGAAHLVQDRLPNLGVGGGELGRDPRLFGGPQLRESLLEQLACERVSCALGPGVDVADAGRWRGKWNARTEEIFQRILRPPHSLDATAALHFAPDPLGRDRCDRSSRAANVTRSSDGGDGPKRSRYYPYLYRDVRSDEWT